MIYDRHAYCFPDLGGDGGFSNRDQFRRHLQLAIGRHFQPAWRKRDRAPARSERVVNPSGGWSFDSLHDAGFRPEAHGRFEWTAGGETYVKQYLPPSITDVSYPAERLVAEMDYAGVDMALRTQDPVPRHLQRVHCRLRSPFPGPASGPGLRLGVAGSHRAGGGDREASEGRRKG